MCVLSVSVYYVCQEGILAIATPGLYQLVGEVQLDGFMLETQTDQLLCKKLLCSVKADVLSHFTSGYFGDFGEVRCPETRLQLRCK